jgi:hypothetical protein
MSTLVFEVSNLEDLEGVAASVGLPVGPRTGAGKRTKIKKEWYVLLEFLRKAIPAGVFELPIVIRSGRPLEDEPDFILTRGATDEVIGLVEITEATDESDQREMALSECSEEQATLLGQFGGRFADGASNSGLVWASDIVDAIKRKDGKSIFRPSPIARHLIIYPNSNASILLFDEKDEREAIHNLSEAIAQDTAEAVAKGAASLVQITNGCLVHVLGKKHVCFDALNDVTVLPRTARPMSRA